MSRKLVCLAVLVTALCAQLCAFERLYKCRIDYDKLPSTAEADVRHRFGVLVGKFHSTSPAPNDVLAVDRYSEGGASKSGLFLYRANGDGTMEPYPKQNLLQPTACGLAGGLLDGNDLMDAVTAFRQIPGRAAVCLCNPDGTFSETDYSVDDSSIDVCVGNIDDEPAPDIVTTSISHSTVSCLYNNGAGGFSQPPKNFSTGSRPVGVILCDVDLRNGLDIVTVNRGDGLEDGSITTLKNDSGGSFGPAQSVASNLILPFDLCAGFLDRDENGEIDPYPDLVVVDAHDSYVGVLLNDRTGSGGFQIMVPYPTGMQVVAAACHDVDGDGNCDIVAAGSSIVPGVSKDRLSFLRNNGDGTFDQPLLIDCNNQPECVGFNDANLDGWPDILSVGSRDLALVLGIGGGQFEQGQQHNADVPIGVEPGDLNGDGVPDVVAGDQDLPQTRQTYVSVFLNDGFGSFPSFPNQYPAPYDPALVHVADIDGLNGKDIVSLCYVHLSSTPARIWWCPNLGNGTFGEPILYDSLFSCLTHRFCLADVTGDARPDLITLWWLYPSDEAAGPLVMRNTGAPPWFERYCSPRVPTGLWAFNLVIADMDGVNGLDIVVAGKTPQSVGKVCVFLNNGSGYFTAANSAVFLTGVCGATITAGFIDDDSYPDIIIGSVDEETDSIAVLLNKDDGSGGLENPVVYAGNHGDIVSCCVSDIDGDPSHTADVIACSKRWNDATVFLNDGHGILSKDDFSYGIAHRPSDLDLADVDDDGDLDAVASSYGPTCGLMIVHDNQLNNVSGSSFSRMTYPNEARHIGRAPNVANLDWVYQSNNGVFWRWRTSTGLVGPVTRLATGGYPAIAEDIPDRQMVVYSTGTTLEAMTRRIDGTWIHSVVVPAAAGESIDAPSLVLSSPIFPTIRTLGYVAYTVRDYAEQKTRIGFAAFDSLGVYYDDVLDSGNYTGLGAVSTPSVARTPGDYLNVAWCHGGAVCFVSSQYAAEVHLVLQGRFPPWCDITYPSHDLLAPNAEPASHCFVEAQGEHLAVAWRGMNSSGENIGDIWSREGILMPPGSPNWLLLPYNVSGTLSQESDFPVASTQDAIVWAESLSNNWEVQGYVNGQPVNLSNTPLTDSKYPHAELVPSPPWLPDPLRLFTLWTEEVAPQSRYEVRCSDYVVPPSDAGGQKPCLTMTAGESVPSLYCVHRDGFDRTAQVHYDYAESSLTYCLPYLHPLKYYYVEAVAYQNRSQQTKQRVRLPNGKVWDLTLRKSIPETLRCVIPRGLYDSTRLVVHIDRLSGSVAALASVRLYEFEIIQKKADGGQAAGNVGLPAKPSLAAVYPNPFRANLAVRYQLPSAGRVSLKVYDMTGRLVKTLANGTEPPGTHVASFRGADDKGRSLPAGVYLVRFTAGDVVDARRVVLTR